MNLATEIKYRGGKIMKNNSERIKRNNLIIDVTIMQTKIGDYVATAKFPGNLGMSVSRHTDPVQAKEICIERLITNKYLLNI